MDVIYSYTFLSLSFIWKYCPFVVKHIWDQKIIPSFSRMYDFMH